MKQLQEAIPADWKKVRDRNYREAYQVNLFNSHSVAVKWIPNDSGEAISRVELKPASFNSWEKPKEIISRLGDLKDFRIARVDLAADANIPLEDIHQCVRMKKKKKERMYFEDAERGIKTGFYFGKPPEVMCIYNRGTHILKDDRLSLKKLPGPGVTDLTRFEVRKTKSKPDYTSLLEIEKYAFVEPFSDLEWLEPDYKNESKKALLLAELLAHTTLAEARAKLNHHHNFNQRYMKYLKPRDISGQMNGIYRENTVKYFDY